MSDPKKTIITRQDAIERGLTRYYTGEECKRGHLSERWTLAGSCIECVDGKKANERERVEAGRLKAAAGGAA